jgi:hypothetical protein
MDIILTLNNHLFFICVAVLWVAAIVWIVIEIRNAPILPSDDNKLYDYDEHPNRYYSEGIMDEIHKN